jgi:DNA-binding CsgD family transcriptional regulator/tetratricopeptide (TPR) repeat protein
MRTASMVSAMPGPIARGRIPTTGSYTLAWPSQRKSIHTTRLMRSPAERPAPDCVSRSGLPFGMMDVVGVRCPVLVGRDAELGMLQASLAAALEGRGGFAAVCGDAGLGKSRLCRELIEGSAAQGLLVTVGRAVPSGASMPYRPLAEAVLGMLRPRGDWIDEPRLAPWLPVLAQMVPVPGVRPASQTSSAARGEAMLRLLGWLGGEHALLMVLEDLHWADPDTLDVIEYLADNLSREPVLCVGTLRPRPPTPASELTGRLGARNSASVIELTALDVPAVDAIAHACAPAITDSDLARIRCAADGVPFLVEELVGSPGVPRSFAESVRARTRSLEPAQVDVLVAAALLGRSIDWTLLAAAAGQSDAVVAAALEAGVRQELLVHEAGELRFRHTLTRDALRETVLPPQRAELAAQALAAVEAAHPGLADLWAGVAAELAAQSGSSTRAGELLAVAGTRPLAQGAFATAAETLERATVLLPPGPARALPRGQRVAALAMAGQVDAAMDAGAVAIDELAAADEPAAVADLHLHLAQAAVAAGRWSLTRSHVERATALLAGGDDAYEPVRGGTARAAVLEAEARFATDDVSGAVELAESVIGDPNATAEGQCHACELLGRAARLTDLARARAHFERGLAIADAAGLGVWRLRAMHEVATIELLDEAGTSGLLQAQRTARSLGVLGTVAMLDIQLAGTYHMRFELDNGLRHAEAALRLSERLGLSRLRVIALWFLAENHALRRDRAEAARLLALAQAAAPGDTEIEGMAWAGAWAMAALLDNNRTEALDALAKGMAILPRQPQAPGHYRAMWPLLLAAESDARAAAALAEARELGIQVNRVNRGLLGAAEAILRGRSGDPAAAAVARSAWNDLARYPVWRDLALMFAGEAGRRDRWGEPDKWLADAADGFTRHGLEALTARCRSALSSLTIRWADLGITAREAEVLGLVAEGLANRDVAARLSLSVRTVEKHMESLLRKSGCASRTQLVAFVHS